MTEQISLEQRPLSGKREEFDKQFDELVEKVRTEEIKKMVALRQVVKTFSPLLQNDSKARVFEPKYTRG